MKRILLLMLFGVVIHSTIHSQAFNHFNNMGYNESYMKKMQQSAALGNVSDQYLYGKCLLLGDGIERNKKEGFKWIKRAAMQDLNIAKDLLAFCYELGWGVRVNYQEAYNWYYRVGKGANGLMNERKLSELKKEHKINEKVPEISYHKENIFNSSQPPILEIVPNSIVFVDPNKNNRIDANESCSIKFKIKNIGKGNAYNCIAKVSCSNMAKEIPSSQLVITSINVNEQKEISISIHAIKDLTDGTANLILQVTEPHGFGTDDITMNITTKKFDAPLLKVVDSAILSANGSTLKKKSPFELQILLQNTKGGEANDVVVSLELPQNVLLMEEQKKQEKFESIKGGDTKTITYPLIVNNNYYDNIIPIKLKIKEKYGKYGEDKIINLTLNQDVANNSIVIKNENQEDPSNINIKIASIGSDVDKNIPNEKYKNSSTFTVIIANELYNKEVNVPYASNDGKIFSEYCQNTLGIPNTNIHFITNATLNDIRHEIKWLQDVIAVYNGDAKVIFYYAGHGIPDEQNKSAYLLPIDGYGSDTTTGYALEDLYKALGSLPSKSVTVFLDACFSGAKRDGDMLASARGVAIKVKQNNPIGNMVVFTAAQGDETAYPYKEEGHGLFTYYLLKKLQETKGDVTLGELGDYIKTQVERQSIVTNGKLQSPSILPASSIGNGWKEWKLNK